MKKFRFLLVLALMFQLVAAPLHSLAADSGKPIQIDYLALGDSLAFGVNSDDEDGEGYTDFVAQAMQSTGVLKSFNKGFSKRGYTSTEVLNDLKDNATKPVIGIGYEAETAELHASIEAAEIITLTVGANDVIGNINLETGVPVYDPTKVMASINQVGKNHAEIISRIHAINPDVQVYVMGYYNPFPHIQAEYQGQLNLLLDGLNKGIQAGIFGTNSLFVPTAEAVAVDYAVNLPNPQNIHLSEVGHKVVADLFNTSLLENYSWIPEEAPMVFTDINTSEFKEFIEQSVALGLIKGHTDGTFKPTDKLSRVQAAAIIVRALGLKTDEKAPFSDIGNYDEETQAEIAAAYKYGIVKGSNEKFMPGESVTRAQLALMIKRTYELQPGSVPYIPTEMAPFSDLGNYDEETKNAITMLYDFEIALGSDGQYMPSNPTTRGQAAKMFVNFVKLGL